MQRFHEPIGEKSNLTISFCVHDWHIELTIVFEFELDSSAFYAKVLQKKKKNKRKAQVSFRMANIEIKKKCYLHRRLKLLF